MGPDFRRVFRELINTHRPDIAILTETRISRDRANRIIATLGFDHYIKVDAMGFVGGIWVLWNPNVITTQPVATSFQEFHLECRVNGKLFLLTAICASPCFEKRKLLWSSFINLAPLLNKPWLILGDFNDIAKPSEKFGGGPPSTTKLNFFNHFLNCGGLLDLGFVGPLSLGLMVGKTYTILELVLTLLMLPHWITLFPVTKIYHLPRVKSDHCPILLQTSPIRFYGTKPFRFETMRMSHKDFPDLVKNSWNQRLLPLQETIEIFKEKLTHWNKFTFKNLFYQKKQIIARLSRVQKTFCFNNCDQHRNLERHLHDELLKILRNGEEFWMLKSRVSWLSLGDKNSKFFHKSALIRRRRNKITQLINRDGNWIFNPQHISTEITNHLKNIHAQHQITSPPNQTFLNMLPKLSEEDCISLIAPSTELEIKNALWSIHPFKTPGDNVLHAIFYQKNWDATKDKII